MESNRNLHCAVRAFQHVPYCATMAHASNAVESYIYLLGTIVVYGTNTFQYNWTV